MLKVNYKDDPSMFWQVTFEGIVASGITGDVAIDDFFFTGGACPYGKYFYQRVYLHVFWEEKKISSWQWTKNMYLKFWIYENHICELRSEELDERWSSQLYCTQLLQLRKESLKKIHGSTGFEPWPLRYLCTTLPIKLTSQLGSSWRWSSFIYIKYTLSFFL